MSDESSNMPSVEYLVDALAGPRRRSRQDAAHYLALKAHEDASQLTPFVDDLIDALYRPEAQTRWEVFDALGQVAESDPNLVEEGYDGAEASLFDESSATVRLAAFRFLCRLGASSPERSDMVWQLIDESVQCYHGDPEYHDMLVALLDFAKGSTSPAVASALRDRVAFDAENGHGYVKGFSAEIIAALAE
jgi:hypothetical protein